MTGVIAEIMQDKMIRVIMSSTREKARFNIITFYTVEINKTTVQNNKMKVKMYFFKFLQYDIM